MAAIQLREEAHFAKTFANQIAEKVDHVSLAKTKDCYDYNNKKSFSLKEDLCRKGLPGIGPMVSELVEILDRQNKAERSLL